MSCSKGWSKTSKAEGFISTRVELVSVASEWVTARSARKRVRYFIVINK